MQLHVNKSIKSKPEAMFISVVGFLKLLLVGSGLKVSDKCLV